jgi:hypothetical protein
MNLLILGVCVFAVVWGGEVPGLSTSPSSATGRGCKHSSGERREPSLPWLVGRSRNSRPSPNDCGRSVDRWRRGYPSWTVHRDVSRADHHSSGNGTGRIHVRRGQWRLALCDVHRAVYSDERGAGRLNSRNRHHYRRHGSVCKRNRQFHHCRLLNQGTHASSGSFSGTIDLNH